MKYPCRCKIVDVAGEKLGPFDLKTPDESKPFIGLEGVAYKIPDDDFGYRIRIEMDNGEIIYGDECWWEPII